MHTDSVRRVSLADLKIDSGYQRPLVPAMVNTIANNFNDNAVGVLAVNVRPTGELFVIDGQQRRAGAMKAGVTSLLATIYELPTRREEAGLFIQLNKRSNLSPLVKYNAALCYGETAAVQLDTMLSYYGLAVKKSSYSATTLGCVGCLLKCLKSNAHALGETLELIKRWDGAPGWADFIVIKGVWQLLDHCDKVGFDLSEPRIQRVLDRSRPTQLRADSSLYDASFGEGRARGVAKVLLAKYNKGLRLQVKQIPKMD